MSGFKFKAVISETNPALQGIYLYILPLNLKLAIHLIYQSPHAPLGT